MSLPPISVVYDGDATGATAAAADVFKSIDKLVAKEADLKQALEDINTTSKLTATQLGALKKAHVDAAIAVERASGVTSKATGDVANAFKSLGPAASSAQQSIGAVQQVGAKLDNTFGPLQTAISGVSQAMGGSAQTAANLAGGFADIGMAMVRGGGMLAAVVAVGAAVSVVVGHFQAVEEAAKKAADEAAKRMKTLGDEISDLRMEMEALAKGTTVKILKQSLLVEEGQSGIDKEIATFGEGRFKAGGAASLSGQAFMDPKTQADFTRIQGMIAEQAKQQEKLYLLENALTMEEMAKLEEKAKRDQESGSKASGGAGAKASDSPTERADDALAALGELAAGAVAGTAGVLAVVNEQATLNEAITGAQANALAGMTDYAEEIVIGVDKVENAHADMEAALFGVASEVQDITPAFDRIKAMAYEFADVAEQVGIALGDMIEGLSMADVAGGVETVASGGFQAGGVALGSTVGSVIDVATGGATGGLGTVIGGIVGGVLGKALDALVEALGVLTPLFDAVAVIIKALSPILVVVKELFTVLGNTIVNLAPLILALAKPTAALLLVFVRLIQAILPFIDIIILAVTGIVMFADFLTWGIALLDEHFFRPLISGVAKVYNGFVAIVNTIIQWIRDVTGNQEFGVKAKKVSEDFDDIIGNFQSSVDELVPRPVGEGGDPFSDSGGAGGDGADAGGGGASGQELTNIPSGYKRLPGLIYDAADGRNGPEPLTQEALMVTINIDKWNSSGDMSQDMKNLQRVAKQGSASKMWLGRRQIGDRKN